MDCWTNRIPSLCLLTTLAALCACVADDASSTAIDSDTDGLSAECSEFLGDDPGDAVELAIVNTGDEPIYLAWPLRGSLSILAPGVDWTWSSGTSCAAVFDPDRECATPFVAEQVLRIEPGAQYLHPWEGQLFESEPVPLDCVPADAPDEGCELPANCSVPRTPPPGGYTASLTVYPAFSGEDSDSDSDDAQDCSEGVCVLQASVAGEPMEVETTFDMPTTRVEIVW